MPISAETAARSEQAPDDEIVDQESYQPQSDDVTMPSNTVQPTTVEDTTQQGATQPGAGSTVPGENSQPRFKEKVIGYAKEMRGKTLGKTDTKEQGQRIVRGEEKFEPKKVGPKS